MNKSTVFDLVRRHSWIVVLGSQIFVQLAIVTVVHRSIAIDQRRSNHPWRSSAVFS
ncbi:MAG: hypothetical protein HC860_26530 [Alkalinema sp. RU_4_3]|nr:hypothetical protein [Alkalinema sp. RU_4_3]